MEELYAKDKKPVHIPLEQKEVVMFSLGPEVLREEIIKAIHHLADGKSVEIDGVPAEMSNATGTLGVKAFVEICGTIYKTGIWLDDWLEQVLKPIEKN